MKTNPDSTTPRVISYTRFSSRKQAKGLSYVRQVESARDWCKQHNLTLDDENFEDLGVSAYSGANSETGALADLQRKLVSGEIPRGTILIVEALDRITRQALPKAVTLLMSLANSGLVIVTLSDGKTWDEASMADLGSFMMSVVTLYRGHQESEYKSLRLRKTFKKHRELGSTQAFGSAPGWLHRESNKLPWEIDEEKAQIVRRVFELSASGLGSKAIAARANVEQWAVPARLNRTAGRWHGQLPGQLLRNRAVLGELQHRIRTHEANAQHWQGFAVGMPVSDYYPRIISDELWLAARASIRTRSVNKRRDSHFYNVFSGLLYCGNCGAPIHRKNEKNGFSRAQLQCSDRLAGITKCSTMSARNADMSILQSIYEYSHESLGSVDGRKKSDEVAVLENSIADKLDECARIADAVAKTGGRVQAFIDKSIILTNEVDELKLQLQEREEEGVVQEAGPFDESFVREAMKYLYVADNDDAKERRALLNLQLTRLVETIWIFAYDSAFIKFKSNDAILALPLPGKRLPSRANPNSKNHKKPEIKPEPAKPIWQSHLSDGITLPKARKPTPMKKKVLDLIASLDEDDEN